MEPVFLKEPVTHTVPSDVPLPVDGVEIFILTEAQQVRGGDVVVQGQVCT